MLGRMMLPPGPTSCDPTIALAIVCSTVRRAVRPPSSMVHPEGCARRTVLQRPSASGEVVRPGCGHKGGGTAGRGDGCPGRDSNPHALSDSGF
jgi:hypothetical protein